MTDLVDHILRQILAHRSELERSHIDPASVLPTLQQWQEQLQSVSASHHLFWCFSPDLSLWLGPVKRVALQTCFARQRLQDIPIWSLEQELLTLGGARSDTLVLATEQGWTIYVRPQRYREQLTLETARSDQELQQILTAFSSTDDLIRWRRELNLIHEWGHIATDTQLTYQEPLLDKLEPHPPQEGIQVFHWIKTLLEGLAELFPEEGALFLIADLGRNTETQEIAKALLLDRLREYHSIGITEILPGLAAWIRQHLSHPAGTPDWPAFHQRCLLLGEALQAQLQQSIFAIPAKSSGFYDWARAQKLALQQRSLAIF